MTTVELRTSILAELDQMNVEMLENVSDYIKRLRRHSRPASQVSIQDKRCLPMNGALMPLSMNYLNDNSMSIREEQQNTPNKGYIHGVLLGIFTVIIVSLTNMAYHFLICKSRSQRSDNPDGRQQKDQEDVGSVPVQNEMVSKDNPYQVEQKSRGEELRQTAGGLFFGMAFSIMANIVCNSLLADSNNVYEKSLHLVSFPTVPI